MNARELIRRLSELEDMDSDLTFRLVQRNPDGYIDREAWAKYDYLFEFIDGPTMCINATGCIWLDVSSERYERT